MNTKQFSFVEKNLELVSPSSKIDNAYPLIEYLVTSSEYNFFTLECVGEHIEKENSVSA